MLGLKIRTIEDAAISWLHTAAESFNFTFLEEGTVGICGCRRRLWEVTNQIALCWLVPFFNSLLVGHDGDVGIPLRLCER